MQVKDSNIEVLQEMLSGLKTQLKQKDIEIYRFKAKIVSLQADLEDTPHKCHGKQDSFQTPRPVSTKLDEENFE